MFATYLFVQVLLILAFYLMVYLVEAVHWAKVRVRVRSQNMDDHSYRKNNQMK